MLISTAPVTSADEVYEIGRAGRAFDQPDVPYPSPSTFAAALAHPWPGFGFERYVARLDGVPAGYLELSLPQDDNLDSVHVELHVLPSARRLGVGRALYDLTVARARELGRRHLIAPTGQRHPDGAAFAKAMGGWPGLEELRSRLDVRTADESRLDALLAEAWTHTGGYELIRWTGVPPEEHLADIAYLDSRLLEDSPTGDLAGEPERVDGERIRQIELNRIARGRLSYQVGAVCQGRLIAFTVIAGQLDRPAYARQNITLVDPGHRGRRLGLIVKLENLRYVRRMRPGLDVIDTVNAAGNRHMLAINRSMGFQVVESVTQWQRTV
jgi:GNAT superfamily N-acetyltransferase